MLGKERYQEVIFTGTQKPNEEELNSITECLNNPDYWMATSYSVTNNNNSDKNGNYNLKDPALNKCFSEMLGKERYQEVIFTGTQKPNEEELNSITECLNNPEHWRPKTYDIFASNKVENCISNPNPVFTHEVTDYSKISKIERWGQIKHGVIKGHTYVFIKNKGRKNNLVVIDEPVPIYNPIDSYLILLSHYRQPDKVKNVQWRLYFQVGCEIVFYFDHIDNLSEKILNKLGNIPIYEDHPAPTVPVNPPLKLEAGELIAFTKGTTLAGNWDFGLVDKNKNNELPKRLKKFENSVEAKKYKFLACPYEYFQEDIKKKYLKKMKRKKCNPKEIK
jgi:hypothetical protein